MPLPLIKSISPRRTIFNEIPYLQKTITFHEIPRTFGNRATLDLTLGISFSSILWKLSDRGLNKLRTAVLSL